MRPLVSILIPAFNAEKWIGATIVSALRQTWERTEVIVVDDGSSDRTLEIARSFEVAGVNVLSQKNQGGCAARNLAYAASSGDYLQWLDADDLLAPDKVELQMRSVGEGEDLVLLSSEFGRFYHRTASARFAPTALWESLAPKEWLCQKLGGNLWMQTSTWLVSRRLSEMAGPWDEELKKDQDGEYACRLMLHAQAVRFVPGAKTYYRTAGAGSVSQLSGNRGKLESQLQSLRKCVGYLKTLEESERTRSVALRLLNDWSHHFSGAHPDLFEEMEAMAAENGGALAPPRLAAKYGIIERLLGFENAHRVVGRYNRAKSKIRQELDRLRWKWDRLWGSPNMRLDGSGSLASKDGFDVLMLPFDLANPYQERLASELANLGVRVHKRRWVKGLRDEILQFGRGDSLVHLHWLPKYPANFGGWWRMLLHIARLYALRGSGARFVWTVHNLHSHEAESLRMERVLIKTVLRLSGRVIVHSPAVVEMLASEFGFREEGKVAVVPHGNYVGCYPDGISREQARDQLGLAGEALSYLFLGNIRGYKGVVELVQAYRDLDDRESRLMVAGRPINEQLKNEILEAAKGDERIGLHAEAVADEEMQVYLKAADVVVFPYNQILTSGAVVLAMSFGRACVAPRLGCIPEMLDDAGAFLYDPSDPEGLSRALAQASQERGRLAEMGQHNFVKAQEWDWASIARDTLEAYRSALNSSARPLCQANPAAQTE